MGGGEGGREGANAARKNRTMNGSAGLFIRRSEGKAFCIFCCYKNEDAGGGKAAPDKKTALLELYRQTDVRT